jgi:hypothetical protein
MPLPSAAAADAVKRRLASLGWNAADLARVAQVDYSTVLDFLAEVRSPQTKTLGKIEAALDWPAGALKDIIDGRPVELPGLIVTGKREPEVTRLRAVGNDEPPNPVIAAIEADPYLLPEAKAHFLNQYELLRRVQGREERLPYVARGKRITPADASEEARIEAEVRRAALDNPDSPYREP